MTIQENVTAFLLLHRHQRFCASCVAMAVKARTVGSGPAGPEQTLRGTSADHPFGPAHAAD
jgi:hypothetical protein